MASQNCNPRAVEVGQTVTTHFKNAFANGEPSGFSTWAWNVIDTRLEQDDDGMVAVAELEYADEDDDTQIRAVYDFAAVDEDNPNPWDIERPRDGEWFRWNVEGTGNLIPGNHE